MTDRVPAPGRFSFMRLVGLGLEDRVPDAGTIDAYRLVMLMLIL